MGKVECWYFDGLSAMLGSRRSVAGPGSELGATIVFRDGTGRALSRAALPQRPASVALRDLHPATDMVDAVATVRLI